MPMPGWPGMSIIGNGLEVSATSSSISLSSSSPERSLRRNMSRVWSRAPSPASASITPALGGLVGAGLDPLAHLLAGHDDGGVDEVADDLLDVAADVADLGELGRLDLEERRLGELRQPARDLGLADAGRADHQDVLRVDLVANVVGQLLAPPAVAQRDGDGALGVGLADDEAVELGDDLAGGEFGHVVPRRVGVELHQDSGVAGATPRGVEDRLEGRHMPRTSRRDGKRDCRGIGGRVDEEARGHPRVAAGATTVASSSRADVASRSG